MSLFPTTDEDKAYQRGYARGKEGGMAAKHCGHECNGQVCEKYNTLHFEGGQFDEPCSLGNICDYDTRTRGPVPAEQPSTAIEDITPEGAAIIQQVKAQIKQKTIEEIMLWRKENRGKKLGYCTNGMIEDQFLAELINKDYWSINEHDTLVAARARKEFAAAIVRERPDTMQATETMGDLYAWNSRTIMRVMNNFAQPEPKEWDPE